jgi:FemAB-related protein (PEP-CTERM system-associated)
MIKISQVDSTPIALPDRLLALGGYTLLPQWALLIEKNYQYRSYRVASSQNEQITGVLVLTHIKHPVFGNYLVTAPYSSYGGVALPDTAMATEILDGAGELANRLKAEYVNIRFHDESGSLKAIGHWHNEPNYVTFKIDLAKDLDAIMMRYGSNHRNHIRKSLKKDLTILFGSTDLLDDAYEGLAKSMHELGSPYHQKSYLASMIEELGENVLLSVIYKNEKIAGAGVFIRQGDTIINLHANVLRQFRGDYAGEFFYWNLIAHFKTIGFSTFDLGRSLIGSGNDIFKTKWNPERIPLQYWYYLKPGQAIPSVNQKNPKFQIAIETWKRLPAFLVRWIGPYLIKGIA